MQIIKLDDLPKEAIRKKECISTINLYSKKSAELIREFREKPDFNKEQLLKVLNSINNQGIQDIDFKAKEYRIRDKTLAFDDFCSAEKVFLVAYLANELQKKVYLFHDITQLTKTTLKCFIKTFYNSEYVNIVHENTMQTAFFKYMVQEALR